MPNHFDAPESMPWDERLANYVLGFNVIGWGIAGLLASPDLDRWSVVRLCVFALHFTVGTLILRTLLLTRGPNTFQIAAAVPSLILCGIAFRASQPPHLWPWFSQSVFTVATCFTIVSLSCLGSNFAVFPAVRRITGRGPYRFLRHPVYAGELAMATACILARPSVPIVIALVLLIPTLMHRIQAEERLLRTNPSYTEYCVGTPWRLLPGIW